MYNSANSTFLNIYRSMRASNLHGFVNGLSLFLSEDNVWLHYKAVFYDTSIKEEICRRNALGI